MLVMVMYQPSLKFQKIEREEFSGNTIIYKEACPRKLFWCEKASFDIVDLVKDYVRYC